jgi:hypothetical protein
MALRSVGESYGPQDGLECRCRWRRGAPRIAACGGWITRCRAAHDHQGLHSVGVNTTGVRPISLISPIIRIISWGTQRSIGGAASSRLIVNLAKTLWAKSIRTHARISRVSLGALPEGGFLANARNSLATCGDRSGFRRTKYRPGGGGMSPVYALPTALSFRVCGQGRSAASRAGLVAELPASLAARRMMPLQYFLVKHQASGKFNGQ